MGGKQRWQGKRSTFSLLNLFKGRRAQRVVEQEVHAWREDVGYSRKVWASDEDKRNWVAEPGIDRKASAFIARFHASRVSESELQTLPDPYHHPADDKP